MILSRPLIFQDDYVSPEWAVNFTLKFLFPVGRS